MNKARPFEILIVEDNAADVTLIEFMFSNTGIPHRLHFLRNGKDASDFLFKRPGYTEGPTPDLILMDRNLPLVDGREVLRELKKDSSLCRIPVVILTTSSSEREIAEAYCLGAAAFISKPVDIELFQETIKTLCNFWFRCVDLATYPRTRTRSK